MSRAARLLSALLAAAAILPAGASAAASGSVSLRTDGQPIVARIVAIEEGGTFQPLPIACIDREPTVTITGAKGGTAEIRPNLVALWVPQTIVGGKLQTGRAAVMPGTTAPLDLINAFNFQTGGSGVISQLPIGRAPSKGTTYVYAQTNLTVAKIQVPVISNVISIRTSLKNDLGGACPSGRSLYIL